MKVNLTGKYNKIIIGYNFREILSKTKNIDTFE